MIDQVASLTDLPRLWTPHRAASSARLRRLARVAGRIRDEDIALVRERRASTRSSRRTSRCATPAAARSRACARSTTRSRPSFNVTPARGFFHCFGCGEGGDVITFVQKIDGLGFAEAVERLADRYGVQLRYARRAATGPRRDHGPAHRGSSRRTGWPRSSTPSSWPRPTRVAGRQFLAERGFDQDAAEHVRRRLRAARRRRAARAPAPARASPTTSSSPPGWSRRATAGPYDRFRGPAALADPRAVAATSSASARAGSSTTTGSRRSTSTPPRRRSTRRARCSTASTWPARRSRARRRRSSSRATPT